MLIALTREPLDLQAHTLSKVKVCACTYAVTVLVYEAQLHSCMLLLSKTLHLSFTVAKIWTWQAFKLKHLLKRSVKSASALTFIAWGLKRPENYCFSSWHFGIHHFEERKKHSCWEFECTNTSRSFKSALTGPILTGKRDLKLQHWNHGFKTEIRFECLKIFINLLLQICFFKVLKCVLQTYVQHSPFRVSTIFFSFNSFFCSVLDQI